MADDALSKAAREMGKKGGKARLKTMTEEERKERARRAAEARWAGHDAKRPAASRKRVKSAEIKREKAGKKRSRQP